MTQRKSTCPREEVADGLSFDLGIFEPAHFVMERRMMIGIKQLAEGGDRGRLAGMMASAAVFQVLTLGQPPVLVGVLLVALVLAIFRGVQDIIERRPLRTKSSAVSSSGPEMITIHDR